MSKKILLTGATGFLGSHLLESFISQRFDVAIMKRSTSDIFRISHLLGKIKIYDLDDVKTSIIVSDFKPEIVVHTACSYGRNDESITEIIKSNLVFGLDLLEESIKNNVKTFINTDTLLPRNINYYSLTKAQFADWLKIRSKKIQVINLKIEHMYGVKDGNKKFIPWLIKEMINGNTEINLTSGIQKRDFIYITDVVSVYNLIIQKSYSLTDWEEFDVGTNIFTEVKEFVLKLANLLEIKFNKSIVPRLNFGSIPYREEEVMIPKLENSKLLALGWEHKVEITDGVSKILKEYK
jgi:nucleoside-diphosphate-sugar epimerase